MKALAAVFAGAAYLGGWWVGLIACGIAYFLECWLFPWGGTCWGCWGKGRYRSWFSKGSRKCGRCRGSGEAVRLGVQVLAWWTSNTAA